MRVPDQINVQSGHQEMAGVFSDQREEALVSDHTLLECGCECWAVEPSETGHLERELRLSVDSCCGIEVDAVRGIGEVGVFQFLELFKPVLLEPVKIGKSVPIGEESVDAERLEIFSSQESQKIRVKTSRLRFLEILRRKNERLRTWIDGLVLLGKVPSSHVSSAEKGLSQRTTWVQGIPMNPARSGRNALQNWT